MRRAMDNRAAQYLPFTALTGFGELVEQASRHVEPRRALDGEEAERISTELGVLERGDRVLLEHYTGGAYVTEPAVVREVDVCGRVLRLEGMTIAFDNLWSVRQVN